MARSIDSHTLSDRNEGEGRFGNRARLQHTQRHLTAKKKLPLSERSSHRMKVASDH